MTPEALAERLASAGVPHAGRLAGAAAPLAAWLASAPEPEVLEGLRAAADPVAALNGFGRLLESGTMVPPGRIGALLQVLGGSPALATTLATEGEGWPRVFAAVFDQPRRDLAAQRAALAAAGATGPVARAELQTALRRHRRREQVRIGGRDLLGLAGVEETMVELSTLAEATMEAAVECVRARTAAEWGEAVVSDAGAARPARFVVLGMGKLGGEELNYSSDIDVVYVYEQDGPQGGERTLAQFFTRLAEEVTRVLGEVTADGFCFRVDLRLRPGGGQGPVAVSLPAALSYYEAWGQTWERAVWLKARPIAGDRPLGAALLEELMPFVYRRYLDFGTIEDLKTMKRRVDESLRGEAARRDVKLGRGGIREIEFFVQAQQLVHGGKEPRLRSRSTLAALAALAERGYVEPALAARLADAYRFLRDVEHKLQIVHDRQTHAIPADPDDVTALARRCGLGTPDAFWAAHGRHTTAVRAAFDALFHGAEEERRRDVDPRLATLIEQLDQEEQALWRLGRLGFRDLEGAYLDLRHLRDGPPHAPASPRRRQALAALAPGLLGEIARSAAPDRALHHMATFVSTVGARTSFLHLLLENPGVMRLLVRLFATSEFLSAFFLRHPELLDSLVRADLVRLVRGPADLETDLRARLAAAPDLEAELDTLRRFRHEEFLRIGVHDIQGELTPFDVFRQLTWLGERCLRAALRIAGREVMSRAGLGAEPPRGGLVVLGMGKLGGEELNYASDLDLIFVYDPGDAAWWGHHVPHEVFTRIAQRTISALQTPTREGIAYRIDTRLRPSGNQGPLVSSVEAFERYHASSARVWERQALIKARPLAGPPALRQRLAAIVERFVYGRGLEPAEVAEIADIRTRIERERATGEAGVVHIKTGRGGLVDVEFLAQVLQLRHGHAHPAVRVGATGPALVALAAAGLLPRDDAGVLIDGYGFLRALENRLRLERDQPVEALEDDPDTLLSLARRLGYEGTDAEAVATLRADHARHRDAIRTVYERYIESAAS